MNRSEILLRFKKYFSLKELFCHHVINKYSELSWQFLDTELLHVLLVLREDIIKKPMTINYSDKEQRGLRCNLCQLVRDKTDDNEPYLSAHCNGAGVDFDVNGMSAEGVRELIRKNKDKLPCNIRLEKDVNWVHIDIYDPLTGLKINEFKG